VLGTSNDTNSEKEYSDVSGDIEKPGHSAPVSEVSTCRGNTVPDRSQHADNPRARASETGAEWPGITIDHRIIALLEHDRVAFSSSEVK
jgi:hypothetical protein